MSQEQLENKVAGYLRDSLVLEDYWQKPITAEQLQAEIDRMARDTKQPEVLRELFEALGNDPAVIAECLARPILAERLIADLSAQDQTRQVESPRDRRAACDVGDDNVRASCLHSAGNCQRHAQTSGGPRAPLMPPMRETFTRQYGPALK